MWGGGVVTQKTQLLRLEKDFGVSLLQINMLM